MSLREEATAGVDGDASGQRRVAFEARPPAVTLVEEAEVFDVEDLGDGEAVVHLGAVDVARTDPGHGVRALRCHPCDLDLGEAVLLVQVWMIGCHTEPGHVNRLVGELTGSLRSDEQDGGGAVGLRAAVEQMQRMAHGRRLQHVVDRDLVLEVRVRIARAVVVVLHRDRCEHLACGAELVHVAGRERREA